MKTLMIVAISTLSLSGMAFNTNPGQYSNGKTLQIKSAKQDVQELMKYFRVHRQGKSAVSVGWGMTSQAGIDKFIVERSYDGDFFDPVTEITPTSAMKYSVKDDGIFPGYIHYRIGCLLDNGTMIYSDVEIVRIVMHY